MTHDELLNDIGLCLENNYTKFLASALRAVVELHNPVTDYYDCYNLMCKACSVEELVTDYPCPTIQTIQEQLK